MEKIIKSILFTVIIILLFSCKQQNNKNYIFLELNNKELEKQIIAYDRIIQSSFEEPYNLVVTFCQMNDSVAKFYISFEPDMLGHAMSPFHFITQVNDKEVFFRIQGMNNFYNDKKNFFQIKNEFLLDIAQKYFPENYNYYLEEKEFPFMHIIIDDDIWELTFLREKLISKRNVKNTCE